MKKVKRYRMSTAGDLYRDEVGVDTDGVVVDHNIVTSDPDIYAAGDICSASSEPSERCGILLFNIHPGSSCGKISREECKRNIANGINIAHSRTSEGCVKVVLENMSL